MSDVACPFCGSGNMVIPPGDLEVDVRMVSGHYTFAELVTITHKPTGLVASSMRDGSTLARKTLCMQELKAALAVGVPGPTQ